MNLRSKKTIAREGLILLGIIALGLLVTWLLSDAIGVSILIFVYPGYLFFHFIFWAIKTLLRKE